MNIKDHECILGGPPFLPDENYEQRLIFTLSGMDLTWQMVELMQPAFAEYFEKEYLKVNGQIPFEHGFVYLLHAKGSNYYKIGKTISPERRFSEISPKMPFETEVVAVYRSYFMSEAEKWMHNCFSTYRANGEWFEFPNDYLANILTYCAPVIKYAYCNRFSSQELSLKEPFVHTSIFEILAQRRNVCLIDIASSLDPFHNREFAFYNLEYLFCLRSDYEMNVGKDYLAIAQEHMAWHDISQQRGHIAINHY